MLSSNFTSLSLCVFCAGAKGEPGLTIAEKGVRGPSGLDGEPGLPGSPGKDIIIEQQQDVEGK